ncbi:MAG: trimethylamine methyltransferase family protein, partial [Candidatus Aminicenantes bacterium]
MNFTVRPKLELLTTELIEKIIHEAFLILEKEGIFIENEEALKLFKAAGMKTDDTTQRVHLTGQLVEDSLSSTPSSIKLYDRTGDKEYVVGGNEVHFDPGSAAVSI